MFSTKDQQPGSTALADAFHAAGFESNHLREVRKIIRAVANKYGGDPAQCLPGIWKKINRHPDGQKMLRAVLEFYATEVVGPEAVETVLPPIARDPVPVVEHTRGYPQGAAVRTTTAVPGAGAPTEAQKEAERTAAKEYADRIYFKVIHGRDIREVTFGEIAQIVQNVPILQRILSFAANWTPNQRVRDVIKDSELTEIINGAS